MTNPTLDAKASIPPTEETAPSVVTDTELPDGKDTLTKELVVSDREDESDYVPDCTSIHSVQYRVGNDEDWKFWFRTVGDKKCGNVRFQISEAYRDDSPDEIPGLVDIELSVCALRRLQKMLGEVCDETENGEAFPEEEGESEQVRISPKAYDNVKHDESYDKKPEETPEERYERAARDWEIASARLDRQWGLRTVAAQILATVITSLGAWWYCRHTGNYDVLWFFVEAWFAVMSLMLVFLMVVPATVDTIRKRRYLKGLKAEADKAAQTSFTVDAKEAA